MQFHHGSIVRVTMENFMLCDDMTVYPQPGFNVVLGHNGSGKSALVTALCLGLGGELGSLARCEQLESLVRRGAHQARLEVELHNSGQDGNWVVGCTIPTRGRPGFTVNGNKCSKGEVAQLVAGLNIQTDNMCQFLPQDVVKNFPLMTPQERFVNTLKAVGQGVLVDQFGKLKEIQETIGSRDELISTKNSTLESLQSKMIALNKQKLKMENIEKLQSDREIAVKKRKWTVFENDIKEGKRLKKITDDIKSRIEENSKGIETCARIDTKRDDEISKAKKKLEVPKKTVQSTERRMMEPNVRNTLIEIEHMDQMIKNEEEDKVEKASMLERTKSEIEKITRELKHCSSDNTIDNEITKLKVKEHEIENKVQTLTASKSDLSYTLKSLQQNVKNNQSKLKDLKSAENQKLNQLKKQNNDTYDAVMYVRKHMPAWQEKGRFCHGVHEPAVLTLSVQDVDNAVYIEKETGSQQLEAFVCEDAEEANDLMQELRQKFRKVSVIHGDLKNLTKYEGPTGERYRDRPRPADLTHYRFVSYVGDMFSGPAAVKVHLYMHTSVFSTAVFAEETPHTSDISAKFPRLKKYYVGKTLNKTSVSKYSKEILKCEEDISYFKPQRLNVFFDRDEISKIEKDIENLQAEISKCNKQIQKINDTLAKIKKEIADNKKEVSEHNELKMNKKKLEITLKHREELVLELTRSCTNDESQSRLGEYNRTKKSLTLELVKQSQDLQETLAKSNLQYLELELFYLQLYHVEEKYRENSRKLKDLVREKNNEEEALIPQNACLNEAKDELRKSKVEAHSCTADESRDVAKKPPPNYAAAFQIIEAKTVEEIDAHIGAIDRLLKAEAKLIKDQEKINNSHAEKTISINQLKAEIEVLVRERSDAAKESENISTLGVNKIDDLIAKVNDKFAAYFAELGFTGEVKKEN